MRKLTSLNVWLLLGGTILLAQTADHSGRLTIDRLIDIRHPSDAKWSPDGKSVAFLWDRGGVQNVWVTSGESAPRQVTSYDTELIESLDWSADGKTLLFVRDGLLLRVARDGGEPESVWLETSATPVRQSKNTSSTNSDVAATNTGVAAGLQSGRSSHEVPANRRVSDVALSPDGGRVAFIRDGDVFVRAIAAGPELRLTRGLGGASGPVWSPAGDRIAFSVYQAKRVEESAPYAGSKVVFTRFDRQRGRVAVVSAAGGDPVYLAKANEDEEAPRWVDRHRVVVQRVSDDLKTRKIVIADARTGHATVVHQDTDPKWWSLTYLNSEPVPSPDGRWVAFVSDADGWDHLYLVPSAGGSAMQVTRGRYEVTRFSWSPDSRQIVFDRNEEDRPGVRQLVVATMGADPAQMRLETFTEGRGTNTNARWSPDGRRFVFEHTDGRNAADFYLLDASSGSKPHRLTDSIPPNVDRQALVEPELVRYAGPAGAQVPAYLFVPPGLDRARKHPAIVWVHGDGINQNYDGWHIHRDYGVYYSFHQYLAQQGYVVLAVDYRGSIGYGREWRQGHYRDLGGKDYEDIAAGASYLASLGYVNADRIGIWGLSYGGFMALQALTVTPELFRCAIDVAGVEDWNDWYRDPGGPWIRGRMGRPGDDPTLYRRLSPIYHLDKIVRPLLVMHGTSDVNVPFLESVRLIDELVKSGKTAEFIMYPGEFHYFHRAHVVRDAWSAAERFFDRHLKTRE
jgi:dipeptidyl aminopeptidase/acylaminoacyl peptidase